MNSFKKLLSCLMLGLVVLTYSCKDDDDDPVGCNYATEIQDELNTLNAAAEAWSLDPNNTVKCQTYKNSAQAYLDELQDHVECATISGQEAELQSAINSAQASVDAIQC